MGQKRLRGAKLRYKTTTANVSYSKIRATRFTEIKPIDCPDCHDTMLTAYDWDKLSYLCENCGLTLADLASLSPLDNEEEM